MTNIKASPGVMKVKGLVRDKDGNPKIDDDKLKIFWPYLKEEERKLLQERYDKICGKT